MHFSSLLNYYFIQSIGVIELLYYLFYKSFKMVINYPLILLHTKSTCRNSLYREVVSKFRYLLHIPFFYNNFMNMSPLIIKTSYFHEVFLRLNARLALRFTLLRFMFLRSTLRLIQYPTFTYLR